MHEALGAPWAVLATAAPAGGGSCRGRGGAYGRLSPWFSSLKSPCIHNAPIYISISSTYLYICIHLLRHFYYFYLPLSAS